MEIETIKKKSQRETTLEIENLGMRLGVTDVSISNRIQEIEERISGIEDTIEDIGTLVKEYQVFNPKHPENLGYNEKLKIKNNSNKRG